MPYPRGEEIDITAVPLSTWSQCAEKHGSSFFSRVPAGFRSPPIRDMLSSSGMPSTSSIRFLAVLLLVGVASVTPARSASADVPFPVALRHSLLATEALTISEEVELKWVRPTRPDSVTRADEGRAMRGRLLLATGLPPLVLGAILTGFSRPAQDDNCYLSNDTLRTSTAAGLSMTIVGGGLSIGGIVALLRASKAARAAPKSRKARGVLAAAALGSIAASTIIFGFGMGDLVTCWSS
jgi:hypothetical protein